MEKTKVQKKKVSTKKDSPKKSVSKSAPVKKVVEKKNLENILETNVYDQKGKSVGKLSLPKAIFNLKWNADLVHQVVTSMQANARTPVAHAKIRGEVRGGGKKPWRQKGTGRARHGSIRSPLWKGGGVTHGPRNEKDYSRKINKKMRTKALFTVLSEKFRKGQILFIEELSLKNIKTKEAIKIINDLSSIKGFEKINFGFSKRNSEMKEQILMTVPAKNDILKKSFSNISIIKLDEVRNLNPVDLLAHRYIIISQPTESVAFLGGKIEKK